MSFFKPSLIQVALKEYGVTETKGKLHNPRILEYMKATDFEIYDDETAWCSIFINYCCLKAGLKRSGKATARSWSSIGTPIKEKDVKTGDLVVFWRESIDSWKGHVGIVINIIGDKVYTLGGNQKNMVCILPYDKKRVLDYRRLTKN